MTDTYAPSSAIDFLKHFEASNLNTTSPFYYEATATSKTINFGYGINLTAAEDAALHGNLTIKNNLIDWLSANGIVADSTTVAGVAWSSFSETNLNVTGNGNALESSLNSNLSPGDYTSAANSVLTSYVDTIVVSELTAHIPLFHLLPVTTQAALEAMYYNGPGTLGPKTYEAANKYIIDGLTADDTQLLKIAQELAFNANATTDSSLPGLEQRYLGSALLAMGVIPTYDEHNVIIDMDTSGASTDNVNNFLYDVLNPNNTLGSGGSSAEAYVGAWGSGPLESFQNIIGDFKLHIINQYNPQSGDNTPEPPAPDPEAGDLGFLTPVIPTLQPPYGHAFTYPTSGPAYLTFLGNGVYWTNTEPGATSAKLEYAYGNANFIFANGSSVNYVLDYTGSNNTIIATGDHVNYVMDILGNGNYVSVVGTTEINNVRIQGNGNYILVNGGELNSLTRIEGNGNFISATGAENRIGGSGSGVYIYAGGIQNYIHGDYSSSLISGGGGSDNIQVRASASNISGGGGNDNMGINGSGNYISGGSGDDYINSHGGGNYISGGEGSDTLVAGYNDILNGGAGSDTYIFNGGEVTVVDANGSDNLVFGSGINTANVVMAQVGNDLHIRVGSGVTIKGWFTSDENHIETISFDDGTTVAAAEVDGILANGGRINRPPVAVNDTLDAAGQESAAGNVLTNDSDPDGNTLSAIAQTITTAGGNAATIAANGTVTLHAAAGFRGTDSFDYTAQDPSGLQSSATVTVTNLFTNRAPVAVGDSFAVAYGMVISGNVLANDSDLDNDALHVVESSVTTAGGSVIPLAPNGGFSFVPDAGVVGADSFSYTVSDNYGGTATATVTLNIAAPQGATVGTTGNDTLRGTVHADLLFGIAGNDTIKAGNGNDTVYGGAGNDRLYGENGNDVLQGGIGKDVLYGGNGDDRLNGDAGCDILYGENGNDILNGGAGSDTLYGGRGADIFVFDAVSAGDGVDTIRDFSKAQGDKIDLADVLSGYDPVTEALSDFVQITNIGGNSTVSVDRDGTGTDHGFTQIATLTGVTGLTNEEALVASGNLIV